MAFHFLEEVNRKLDQPQQRKSRLASYFEAHYEFQDLYKSPSPSRSPSPELADTVASAWPTKVSRKRSWSSVESTSDNQSFAIPPSKRLRAALSVEKRPPKAARLSSRSKSEIHPRVHEPLRPRSPNNSDRRPARRPAFGTKPFNLGSGIAATTYRINKKSHYEASPRKPTQRIVCFGKAHPNKRYLLRHTPARVKEGLRSAVNAVNGT